MFSDCSTITELNQKRAELLSKKDIPVRDINNAYNNRKKELSSISDYMNKLTKFIPVTKKFERMCTIPIQYGNDNNVIRLTEEGFII